MSTQPKPIKESVDGRTDEEIQRIIDEREGNGASCKVVMEGGHKFLVTQWPPA